MARFGQGFIQALTNPSYQQGLFTAAQGVGAAPGVAAAEQKQSVAMQLVNDALASNDPTKLIEASQTMRTINPDLSVKLAQAAGLASQSQRESKRNIGIQGGLTGLTQASFELNQARINKDAAGVERASQMLRQGRQSVIDLGATAEQIREAEEAGRETRKDDVAFGAGITEWVDPATGKVVERTVQTNASAQPISLTTNLPTNVTGLEKKQAPRDSTVVNVGGSSDYSKEALKQIASTDVETVQKGAQAADNLYSIGEARRVLSETPEVLGAFGKEISATKKGLLKVLDVFGVSPTDAVYKQMTQQVSNADLINVFTQDFVRTRMDATKGAISDREMEAFLASVPNLLQTPEGYKKVLDYLEKANTLAVIKADGLSSAFSTENPKRNAFKFKKDFDGFTRVFSPNLSIPASDVDRLWRSYSENKMSPDNITFSFLDPNKNQTIQATYGDLKQQAKNKNITMDALINTLFTNFNANVAY